MFSLSRRLLSPNRIWISLILAAAILISPLPFVSFRVQAQAGSNTPATMPSPEVAFLVGPQLVSGTSNVSGASWFDQNATSRGLTLCSEFPDVAHTPGNVLITGTVSVTNGSKTVTGVGTKFLTQAKDYAIISNGAAGRLVKIVASVQSDTSLTLTLPWQGSTLTGQSISSPTAQEVDYYQGYLNYYDFAFTQYTNYYRTGDSRFLDCARKVADSWWSQPVIDYGKNLVSASGDGFAPRSVGLTGLILRALDGRPEMWPWITDYVNYQYHNWVEVPSNYPSLYYGIRDGGFMLLYAADLGAVHPDPATRGSFRTRALAGAVNYYARLQYTDGSYRFNVDDSSPGALDGVTGIEQPFQVGILNEGMIAVHRLTGDATVKNAILKSAEHEYMRSYNSNGWRAMYYYIHGSFNTGFSCEQGCGNASNPFPPSDTSQIIEARQLNATAISQFGYAFSITGDSRYRQWGDEIFDATYSGNDGYRGLAAYRGKEYDESYRSGGKYLAWRTGAASPTPSPTPTPSGTPTPNPTVTPTPTPTPTPIPSPTPTPTPSSSVTVKLTAPSGNTTYSLGTSPTLAASASNGVVTRLVFKANSTVLGTLNTTPYSMVWSNPAAGTYTMTASTTDDKGLVATSSPITVKISKALKSVRSGRNSTSTLQSTFTSSNSSFSQSSAAAKSSDVDSLITVLDQAYVDFSTERSMFSAASDIDRYLFAALYLAKSSSALAKQQSAGSGIVDRLNKIDAYLTFCEDLMVDGAISSQSLSAANKINARANISIDQPDVLPLSSNSVNLSPNGSAALSCAASNPMTSVTDVAPPNTTYELGGVSVTVGGTAVSLISVSPTAITFNVPADLPGGLADVIVTTRDGYIVHTTASVAGLNPMIFVQQGDANASGATVNAFGFLGGFSSFSSGLFGDGGNSRLTILASGISTGLSNTNVTNDVFLSNGKLLENYAESVTVEARTSGGKVFSLPVEFAGATSMQRGLDQVTIRLVPELAGAGSVQITVVAGGRRSNTAGIVVN